MHPPPTGRILVIFEAPPSPIIQSFTGSPCNGEEATGNQKKKKKYLSSDLSSDLVSIRKKMPRETKRNKTRNSIKEKDKSESNP
jgi:hypothetical protein